MDYEKVIYWSGEVLQVQRMHCKMQLFSSSRQQRNHKLTGTDNEVADLPQMRGGSVCKSLPEWGAGKAAWRQFEKVQHALYELQNLRPRLSFRHYLSWIASLLFEIILIINKFIRLFFL